MKLSILIPVLNEEDSIVQLNEQTLDVLRELSHEYEVIYVNDGSSDNTAKLIEEFTGQDTCVKLVNFKRNYGQTAAMMAGINFSSGDIIIPMDADLQNDPADIPRLIEKINEGYDVVSGWRKGRKDSFFSRLIPSFFANLLISKLSGVKLHDYGCTLKAYRKEVVKDVKLYGEMHRFIPIYSAWEGAKVTEIPVMHHERKYGQSKYGLSRIFKVILDLLLIRFFEKAFDRPIHFFGMIGLYCMLASVLSGIWMVLLKVIYGTSFILTPLPLLTVFFMLTGIMLILLGVIAELQMRIYFESQQKSPYSVKDTINI